MFMGGHSMISCSTGVQLLSNALRTKATKRQARGFAKKDIGIAYVIPGRYAFATLSGRSIFQACFRRHVHEFP